MKGLGYDNFKWLLKVKKNTDIGRYAFLLEQNRSNSFSAKCSIKQTVNVQYFQK